VLKALQEKTLVFVQTPNNSEYIIGSFNVVKTSNGPLDLHDQSVEVWLPFTRRFAAVLQGQKHAAAYVMTNAEQVHAINCAIAAKSSIIGSRNVMLIEALRPGSKLLDPDKLS
jgi:hypothetical protein